MLYLPTLIYFIEFKVYHASVYDSPLAKGKENLCAVTRYVYKVSKCEEYALFIFIKRNIYLN